ncbi:MAG TPA: hypothetical protein PKK43_09745, partial [Spirochaetota bacterium]|nr:hypothetical protein [Spirochaetota bacterium]
KMLARKPCCIILSKIDVAAEEDVARAKKAFGKKKVIPVSSATGENIDTLLDEIEKLLEL